MRIEVVYIDVDIEFIKVMELQYGVSVREAIKLSGLLDHCANISLDINQVGVFGKVVTLDTELKAGDRVEVYRQLTMDPMEARRIRAERNAGGS